MKLTGKTRYRVLRKYFKQKIILQVEGTYVTIDPYDFHEFQTTVWKDASFEDLQELAALKEVNG